MAETLSSLRLLRVYTFFSWQIGNRIFLKISDIPLNSCLFTKSPKLKLSKILSSTYKSESTRFIFLCNSELSLELSPSILPKKLSLFIRILSIKSPNNLSMCLTSFSVFCFRRNISLLSTARKFAASTRIYANASINSLVTLILLQFSPNPPPGLPLGWPLVLE